MLQFSQNIATLSQDWYKNQAVPPHFVNFTQQDYSVSCRISDKAVAKLVANQCLHCRHVYIFDFGAYVTHKNVPVAGTMFPI